jgi:hypothetical protein
MNVYVGMDVHHKRSQVAIVDDAGVQQRNRNLPTTRPSWCRSLARCRRHPGRLPGRRRLGLAGGVAGGTGAGAAPGPSQPPAAARRSPRPGGTTTRSMRPPWPSCSAPTCCPRPGSRPRPPAICGPCCATGPAWSAFRPHATTGCMRCWPIVASVRTGAFGPVPGGPGWPWNCRQPQAIIEDCCGFLNALAAPIARLGREIAALAKPATTRRSPLSRLTVRPRHLQTSLVDDAQQPDSQPKNHQRNERGRCPPAWQRAVPERQAVRSASIVAVGTTPSTRRASSVSRVTNASAWS